MPAGGQIFNQIKYLQDILEQTSQQKVFRIKHLWLVMKVLCEIDGQPTPLPARPDNGAMTQQDPLWKLRHALAGVGLALLLSVFTAAGAGRVLGDLLGGGYAWRVGLYAALLLYVLVGAVVLFVKVAQHETAPVSPARVAKWFISLWVWPALLMAGGGKPA
jgi:hypothetical protein